jgi:hypothetical protein
MCSTYFGDYYIYHQKLETVLLKYHIGHLFLSSLCVGALVWLVLSGASFTGFSLQHGRYSNIAAPNLQHTMNRERNDRCGDATSPSQAPDGAYINVQNLLSTQEVK